MRLLILTSFLILGAATFSWTQEVEKAPPVIIRQSFPLRVELTQWQPDEKGTDITNMYKINISAGPGADPSDVYTIAWYLDGRRVEIFKNKKLPFSLDQNFKGLPTGEHEIKVEAYLGEDDEHIFAQGSTKVSVIHGNS